MSAISSATLQACLVLSGLATLNLEAASIPARMYLYLFPYRYLKACTTGQIGASHLGSLPGNELYRCIPELVNALARMLVEITIV